MKVETSYYEKKLPNNFAELETIGLANYSLVILVGEDLNTQTIVDRFCRENGIKFISCSANGPFGRVFCDFGFDYRVSDPNGEALAEFDIGGISCCEKGVVTVAGGAKHGLQDGDEIVITGV